MIISIYCYILFVFKRCNLERRAFYNINQSILPSQVFQKKDH